MAIPYFDREDNNIGIWFDSKRGKTICLWSAVYTAVTEIGFDLFDAFVPWQSILGDSELLRGWIVPTGVIGVLMLILYLGLRRWHPTRREVALAFFTAFVVTYITLKKQDHLYYLMKVERRGNDVYGFIPGLGVHYSHHSSGEIHTKPEGISPETKQPPVALLSGVYEELRGRQWRWPIQDLGRAEDIFTAFFLVGTPDDDYKLYTKNTTENFVIDTAALGDDPKWVTIGVWAVPARNPISFRFNSPPVAPNLLYKVTDAEPQIWIYAEPF